MNKYYILYVKDCSPKEVEFELETQVEEFLNNFIKKYGSLDDKNDNWVDKIFYGKKVEVTSKITLGILK